MRRITPAVLAALIAGLALAGAAYAQGNGLSPANPQSPNNERITDLYWFLVAVCGGVFLLVEGALVWFVIRYRRRRRERTAEGPQIHGSTRLEQLWTAIPILLLAAITAFTFYKLPGIKDAPAVAATDRIKVRVEGRQFYWRFVYPGGQISVDRLVVPVAKVIDLELRGEDVIHSWWVPELGGKIDTIPGRTNYTWFQAKREGTYSAMCGEFCGIQHTAMRGTVEVVSEREYRSFLAAHRPGARAVGKESFEGACATCHGLSGEGDIGPPLQGSATVRDDEALERVMREGQGRMPPVARGWSDEQVQATVDYLQGRFGGDEG